LTFQGVDMGLRRTHMHENLFEPVQCRISCAWDGKGCIDSGYVETVWEFDLEGASEPIIVAPPILAGRAEARDGV
jgi:hypothetical protein